MNNTTHTTRRSFLTGALAVGVPALLGLPSLADSVVPDFRKQRDDGKLGVALVGLGGFSTDSIAPELASAKNVYFAGVVTGDPQGKGRKFAAQYGFPEKNIYTYEQMPQLADNHDIDIVHIVTPNGLHPAHAIAAAKAGKHVMCEKPMATTSQDCQAMVDAAHQAGVYLGVNYRLHFEPHHEEMIRLATQKVYGEVKSLSTEFSWKRGNAKPWLSDKKLAGGGAMYDTGVYCIQAGCYITNETPIAVTAIPSTTAKGYPPGIEESMDVILEYPGGAVMQGRASYEYGYQRFIVCAENGTFSCGGSSFGQSSSGRPSPKEISLPNGKSFKAADTLQLAVLHDRFAEAIRSKQPFACPGEMGLRDIRILEAVYASVAQGSKRISI
ncbi:MAG TPA: Gfo/Idh/MocA family oxidoreductase [Candidatus Methylacidiphilales bacterium]